MHWRTLEWIVIYLLLCLPFLGNPAEASSRPTQNPTNLNGSSTITPIELFRIRIQNTLYGAVEISEDQGDSWTLIGRVVRAVTEVKTGSVLDQPEVERASKYGIALATGFGKMIRVLPDGVKARRDKAALLVNLPIDGPLFSTLLPSVGSEWMIKSGKYLIKPNKDFTPEQDQVYILIAKYDAGRQPSIAENIRHAADYYSALALRRLIDHGGKPCTGMLTVQAHPSQGDKPFACIFSLDGGQSKISNNYPFSCRWNTALFRNGEHLIEIKAMNSSGAVLSTVKYLVYFLNKRTGSG